MYEVEDPSVICFPERFPLQGRRHRLQPLPMSGLRLWLRAGFGTFQTSVGSLKAEANNDPVGRWEDSSGSGNHALASLVNQSPLLKLSQIDGKPALLPDGINDRLGLMSGIALSACTVYVVGHRDVSELHVPLGSFANEDILTIWFNNIVYASCPPGDNFRSTPYTGSTGNIRYRFRRDTADVWKFKSTGMAEATLAPATANGTITLDTVFARVTFGGGHTPDTIAELLVWNRNLSTDELAQVDSYLLAVYPSVTW